MSAAVIAGAPLAMHRAKAAAGAAGAPLQGAADHWAQAGSAGMAPESARVALPPAPIKTMLDLLHVLQRLGSNSRRNDVEASPCGHTTAFRRSARSPKRSAVT